MEKIKILLLDTNADHIEIITKNLTERNSLFQIISFSKPEDLIPFINNKSPHIIISEYLFPRSSGLDILKSLSSNQLDTPVIFLTQDSQEESAIEAFRNGAQDFFIKDFSSANIDKLANTIVRALSEHSAKKAKMTAETRLKESYQQMETIFSSMDEIIFIIDDQYHILFANEPLTAQFNKSIIGKKCYTTIFHEKEQCDHCIATDLLAHPERNISVKQELFNPGENTWYRCISKVITWTNDTYVLLTILIDITDSKKKTDELNNRLKYEEAIAEISSKAMMIRNLDDFLNTALRILGEATAVSRVYLFQNYDNNKRTLNTHEWIQEEITPFVGLDADYKDFPYWYMMLSNDNVIMASDIYELPGEVHEILAMQHIISILVVPIWVKGSFFGFIGFDECTKKRQWESYEINLLRATAQIIGAKISYEKILI